MWKWSSCSSAPSDLGVSVVRHIKSKRWLHIANQGITMKQLNELYRVLRGYEGQWSHQRVYGRLFHGNHQQLLATGYAPSINAQNKPYEQCQLGCSTYWWGGVYTVYKQLLKVLKERTLHPRSLPWEQSFSWGQTPLLNKRQIEWNRPTKEKEARRNGLTTLIIIVLTYE